MGSGEENKRRQQWSGVALSKIARTYEGRPEVALLRKMHAKLRKGRIFWLIGGDWAVGGGGIPEYPQGPPPK